MTKMSRCKVSAILTPLGASTNERINGKSDVTSNGNSEQNRIHETKNKNYEKNERNDNEINLQPLRCKCVVYM